MNDSALVYLKIADDIYQKNGFKDIGSVYILYSQVMASKKKINEAFRFVEMAIDEAMKILIYCCRRLIYKRLSCCMIVTGSTRL